MFGGNADNWAVANEVQAQPAGGRRSARVVLAVMVAIAIVAAFLVIGTRQALAPGPRAAGSTQPLQAGKPPPDITGVGFDGSRVQLSALKGKVVLVNFFASWCAECQAEIPDIEKTYKAKHAAGFEVVAVNAWENGDGRGFLRGLGGTYPAVPDPQPAANKPGPIAASYGLNTEALPVSVFVDRGGNVHQVFPGRIDAANIADELKQMGIS